MEGSHEKCARSHGKSVVDAGEEQNQTFTLR